MTLTYVGEPPAERGLYVVRNLGALIVAHYDGKGRWAQIGEEWDCWKHSRQEYKIEVLHKLNLQALVELVAMVGGKPTPAAQVQDVAGWQLVPKEPTKEMIAEACRSEPHVIITYTKPEKRGGTIPLIPLATWRAMLAAAPAAVAQPPGDGKPCSTDAFLKAAVEHIDMGDRMSKFSSALDVWADGSYNEALSYLPGEVRAKLTGKG